MARVLLICLLIGAVTACASPAAQFEAQARTLELHIERVRGTAFTHSLFSRAVTAISADRRRLHVYLGGDGTPTIAGLPADDPTPRNPMMLRLLALDPGPALYLGRPCYHGDGPAAVCDPKFWTSARYSEPVASSMAAALRRFIATHGFDSVVWFGYSGGGVLAVLLAERFPETVAVVTVAANLDVAAWTRDHHRSALAGSLDPATRPPLPASIVQHHYVGTEDRVVLRRSDRQLPDGPAAVWVEVAGFDHLCCWEAIWPQVLAASAAAADRQADNRRPAGHIKDRSSAQWNRDSCRSCDWRAGPGTGRRGEARSAAPR